MADVKGDQFYNRVGRDRIECRQIDELIGLARGIAADGLINQAEVQFLQKWLAANVEISDQPLIQTLYRRVNEVLSDGILDENEKSELFDCLATFADIGLELGEVLKPSSLPLCNPAPDLTFPGRRYCFTGTFTLGQRRACEQAVIDRGAQTGSQTQKTNVLVIGSYVTESWKHACFGNKILQACEWRDRGLPICIVSEAHWRGFL
ncbi:BRCT domain-containing protein [Rhodovulum sp. PH10]|uniref:BRCT domain-containing protein n=1 Tax=Rhodovulum sp. PH10 TaxID=1187851 RepID=UPI000A04D2BB|nr:BRCT domain-containing protein [Rhodovulum sp. PH10]